MKSVIGNRHGKLRKAKERYCSLPKWLPLWVRDYIEDRAWWVCKLHDNDCGEKGNKPLWKAHLKFVWRLITQSHFCFPLGVVLSVAALPVIFVRGHGDYKPSK